MIEPPHSARRCGLVGFDHSNIWLLRLGPVGLLLAGVAFNDDDTTAIPVHAMI
jgi:hypothetical protein